MTRVATKILISTCLDWNAILIKNANISQSLIVMLDKSLLNNRGLSVIF